MKTTAIAAVLALGLAACAGTEVRDETPGLADRGIPSAIRTQSYTPSGIGTMPTLRAEQAARAESTRQAESARPAETAPRAERQPASPERPTTPPPRARRGSSSPPPSTLYTSPPVTPLPTPSTDRAVADFKRDQARSDLDRLRNDPTTLTPEPWREREIMTKQLELDRLDMQR